MGFSRTDHQPRWARSKALAGDGSKHTMWLQSPSVPRPLKELSPRPVAFSGHPPGLAESVFLPFGSSFTPTLEGLWCWLLLSGALSCPPLSLSRGPFSLSPHSLSHPSLFFPWELRLSAVKQPLEDSVKPRGWPLTTNSLGPYVTRTHQKRGVFQSTQGGEAGRGVCVGPAARGSPSLASVTCLHKGFSWRDSWLPPDGYLRSPLGEYYPGNISVLPWVWRPQACGGWFPVGCGPLPIKETGKETWRGRAGVHGVHNFILVNVLSVCGISQSPATVSFLLRTGKGGTQAASLILKGLHRQALSKDLAVEQGGATLS